MHADDAFPALDFASWGYDAVHHGEGWNGVAVASRAVDGPIRTGLDDVDLDVEARGLAVRCGDVDVVTADVPNGAPSTPPSTSRSWPGWPACRPARGTRSTGRPGPLYGDQHRPRRRDVYDPACPSGHPYSPAGSTPEPRRRTPGGRRSPTPPRARRLAVGLPANNYSRGRARIKHVLTDRRAGRGRGSSSSSNPATGSSRRTTASSGGLQSRRHPGLGQPRLAGDRRGRATSRHAG